MTRSLANEPCKVHVFMFCVIHRLISGFRARRSEEGNGGWRDFGRLPQALQACITGRLSPACLLLSESGLAGEALTTAACLLRCHQALALLR